MDRRALAYREGDKRHLLFTRSVPLRALMIEIATSGAALHIR